MREAIIGFLKLPATKGGIIAALMFQMIFSLVWMTGYRDVTDNVGKLVIAIVNEDEASGKLIVEQLQKNLPFQTQIISSLDLARNRLNERNVQLVFHIPANLTTQLKSGVQPAELEYFINEANPAMIKSIMQNAVSSITATVNKQTQATVGLTENVIAATQYSNKIDGMANQMVPMMMVLASFVGAMVMQMNLQQSAKQLGNRIGAWNIFVARGIINILSAFVVALVGSTLMIWLGGQTEHGFMAIWGFQALFLVTFMFVTQLFMQLFGMAGMMINIILLSTQLVSSGAIVPRELLNNFYHTISNYLPATFAVEGIMNLLYGGSSTTSEVIALLAISGIVLVIGGAATVARKKTVHTQVSMNS